MNYYYSEIARPMFRGVAETALAIACQELGLEDDPPRMRFFVDAAEYPGIPHISDGLTQEVDVNGLAVAGETIWIRDARSPEDTARTVLHEAMHVMQQRTNVVGHEMREDGAEAFATLILAG